MQIGINTRTDESARLGRPFDRLCVKMYQDATHVTSGPTLRVLSCHAKELGRPVDELAACTGAALR
jgi:hypothetical protein